MNITDFDNEELKTFYIDILKYFGFNLDSQQNPKIIYFSKQQGNLIFDNKQIVLPLFGHDYLSIAKKSSKLIFNPINNDSLCSFLAIEDAINYKLSISLYSIFEIIIRKKLKIDMQLRVEFLLNEEIINNLPSISNSTFYKFKNIYNILISDSLYKGLISFSYTYSDNQENVEIKFDYPFYKYLTQINSNTLFGITLTQNEIEFFKQIYDSFIIKIFENAFNKPIEIPKNNNGFRKLYTLIKIFEIVKKIFSQNNIAFGILKYRNFDTRINNLNNYLYNEKNEETLKIVNKINILDNEAYRNELKLREDSKINLELIKENIMAKEKNIITKEEISKKFNSEYLNTYNQKIASYMGRKNAELDILNMEIMKNTQDFSLILDMQRLALKIIESDGGLLFFDTRNKNYYFRSSNENIITPYPKKELLVILNRAMQKNLPKYHNYNQDSSFHTIEVALIENLNDIPKEKPKNEIIAANVTKILIFANHIPSIDGEVFDLSRNEEIFQSETDLLFKRNLFVPTEFLLKRKEYSNENNLEKNQQIFDSFIEKFIHHMVNKDKEKSEYIINWLAYFFQNLKKTGIALVLLGDQDVSIKLFWNVIIKKIFGKKYCSTINDNEYETSSLPDIAKYKLFFNIEDINNAGTIFDDNTLSLLIKDLLLQSSTEFTDDIIDNKERIEINGQILITATNPAPYLKKTLSKCTVIDIVNIDKIIEDLEQEDETELEDNILKDLDNFSNLLNNYDVNLDIAKEKFITKERDKLKGILISNIDKNDIETSLDKFIEAIKNKNKEYFKKVEDIDDGTIYKHLINAFDKDDGYFIGQDLLNYYNAVNEQKFNKKNELMDRLKGKDKMFSQEVKTLKILTSNQTEEVLFQSYKTSKEIANKELYKINDYILAENIIIPFGAVITTSQDNIKKYNHPDLENALKINKEYKDNKNK